MSGKNRKRKHSKSTTGDEVDLTLENIPTKRQSPFELSNGNSEISHSLIQTTHEVNGDNSDPKDDTRTQFSRLELSTLPPSHLKYWAQRYRLFSKFNEGIILDDEGWYSVTPERIATQIAKRVWNSILTAPVPNPSKSAKKKGRNKALAPAKPPGIVLDAFCGPGGNAIQFALEAPPGGIVFAIDIDPIKIQIAKHNSSIYGVQDRIEFVIGDSLRISSRFRVDAVYLAPPWGGPNYTETERYDLSSLQPVPGEELYRTFAGLSPNIAITLPKTVDQAQLIRLAPLNVQMEVEGHYLSQKLKMVTAYFGNLANLKIQDDDVIVANSPSDVQELPWVVESIDEEEVYE